MAREASHVAQGQNPPAQQRRRGPFPVLPIPLLLAAILLTWHTELRLARDSIFLLSTLNTFFTVISSALVTYLIGKSFSMRGSPGLNLLACGTAFWGLSGIAPVLFASPDPNLLSTTHDCLLFLSALCQLAGALCLLKPIRPVRTPGLWLLVGFAFTAVASAIVPLAAAHPELPLFFRHGQGAAPFRQFILLSTIVMFIVTAAFVWIPQRESSSNFPYWYCLALLLLAVGLFGVMLQPALESAVNWSGRAAQFVGGVYLLFAAFISARESRIWGFPIEIALKASEERFKLLAAATFEGIAITESGRFTDCNEQFLEIVGYARDEIIGSEVAALLPEEVRKQVLANIGLSRHSTIEHPLKRKDGSEIIVEAQGRTTFHEGRPIRLTAIRDITERKRAEQRLRESEARFRSVLDDSRDEIYRLNLQSGRMEYISPSSTQIVGYSPEELMALGVEAVIERIHPDDRQAFSSALSRLQETGVAEAEYRLRSKDGLYRWISNQMALRRDDAGRPLYRDGSMRDISERKQAEEELRLSEEKFVKAFAANPAAIVLTGFEDGQYLDVNETWTELLGYSREETLKNTADGLSVWVFKEDRLRFMNQLRKEGSLRGWEVELRKKSGEHCLVQLAAQTFHVGSQKMILSTFVDITNRKRAEEALRQSEERYRFAVKATNDAVWDINFTTGKVNWNENYAVLYGRPPESGDSIRWWLDRIHPEDRERAAGSLREAAEGNDAAWSCEYRFMRADGEWAFIDDRAYIVRDESGRALRAYGAMQDLTRRKQIEEELKAAKQRADEARAAAEEANAAKDRFLAILSHELRTPLSPVLLTASSLEHDESLATEIREEMGLIRRSVDLEVQLINDLLDFNRVRWGKLKLEIKPLDVHDKLDAAADICATDAFDKQIEIVRDLRAASFWIKADGARIQQIFWNLIKNAIKFTPEHGTICLRTENIENGNLRITIADSGIGIDPNRLESIFEPFIQSAANPRQGLGLGLAISKSLAEMQGGKIRAESVGIGRGAALVLDFPTVLAEQTHAASTVPEAKVSSLAVLLVEDHEPTARVLAKLLSGLGHKVTAANTVKDALQRFAAAHFDLVISDLGLPDGTGHDLIRKIREADSELPAFALSGYGMEADREQSERAGFSEHITKPVDFHVLRTAIVRITGNARETKPAKLLLVEDHADTASLMKHLLRGKGFEVEWAPDIAKALELADRTTFNVLLADLSLPDGSGLDLIRQLRLRGQALPGVALSGYADPEDIEQSAAAGFGVHLKKPADVEEIHEALLEVLR